MNKVREVVRFHPQTTADVQKHILRKARVSSQTKSLRVMKIDPRVWKEAMKLAKGDSTRIVVTSETEVVVVNKSLKKPKVGI